MLNIPRPPYSMLGNNRTITRTNINVLINIGPGAGGGRKRRGKKGNLPNTFDDDCSSCACIMLLVLTLCHKGFTIHYVGKYYRKTMKKHIKGALSWLSCFFHNVNYKSLSEGPQYVFRDTGIPLFEARVRDFKAKSRRHSELKVYAGGGLPKITRGITRLQEDLGRDYGIEETHWGHSYSL